MLNPFTSKSLSSWRCIVSVFTSTKIQLIPEISFIHDWLARGRQLAAEGHQQSGWWQKARHRTGRRFVISVWYWVMRATQILGPDRCLMFSLLQEVQQCIAEQRASMKEVLEDARLVSLQREGGAVLARMRREDFRFPQSDDYRSMKYTLTDRH